MMAPPPVVVVLLYLLLLLLMISTTTSASAAAANSTPSIIALPGCPARCGKIDISYPFGIKPGCFRPGFGLTCTNHTLFFSNGTMDGMEIVYIYPTSIDVNGAPIFTLPANTDNYSTHWPPPKLIREPFTFSTYNTLYVVGCGISAHLADFETGEVIGTCSSVCGKSNLSAVEGTICGGDGCCSASLYNSDRHVQSYEIRLGRLYGEARGSGYAFFTNEYLDGSSKQDVLNFINGSSVVPFSLDWAIRDRSSCKEAKRNMSTYACRSNNSRCVDNELEGSGYTCQCSSWDDYNSDLSNPYISGGCPDYTKGITLPGCPVRCGDIDIPYPFGIKPGCFRSSDFYLNCTNQKLFLGHNNDTMEVINGIDIHGIDIIYSIVEVNATIFTMPANADSYRTHWPPLKSGGPYTVSTYLNNFYVVGCGISAYLADLETGNVIGTCWSVCGSNLPELAGTICRGDGCCSVSLSNSDNVQSYEIRLDRLYGEGQASEGRAFFTSENLDGYSKQEEVLDFINRSSMVPFMLDWAINDRSSCKEARRNMSTYACRSNYSSCIDNYNYGEGYTCNCDYNSPTDLTEHNPYISGGCPAVVIKNESCSETCGNISVPYPFGLTIVCARDETFVLECNITNLRTTLLLGDQGQYQVTKIMVEEGQVLAEIKGDSSIDGNVQFNHFTRSTIVLDWVVDYMSCADALKNESADFACTHDHSECQDLTNFKDYSTNTYESAYRCKCSPGYKGNPYTPSGCIDINECNDPEKYKCFGTCINYVGSFQCIPSSRSGGSAFDRTKGGILVGVTVAVGFPLLFLSIIFLYRRWKKRSLKRVREKHFHKNRGLLLQQLISSDNDIAERTRIFSLDELAKATNKFDEARVLGRGGHGTVFKGILSDQRVVAIKKSKINVQSEIDQFLNEVVILSQINHRNVVKLFGCCLESEVPLLVYEFVSNGTLSDHLHHPDRRSSLSWEDRLSIARDASGALSYLHSAASISIFHRDVKSSNILLDDHFTAKVSDFGASRSIPLDMTRVVTVVQGTFGYLDPEYYHTGQLTEKSDVYSFGVILVELLTGEKPISFTRPEEERNLCTHFLSALRDGRLSQILEARVQEEATREEIDMISKLAETCLRLSGEDRPTMKRVEVSLEGLRQTRTRKRHPRNEPKDEESVTLLPSNEEQAILSVSLTLPR